jgi:hypothetical protein
MIWSTIRFVGLGRRRGHCRRDCRGYAFGQRNSNAPT